MIGFRNRKGGGVSFACQPLLDSQVIRIFCLKNLLIILKVVTYVIYESMFSSCNESARKLLTGHLLRDDSQLGEDVPR